jgi:uncharacterized protein (DUF342 family)
MKLNDGAAEQPLTRTRRGGPSALGIDLDLTAVMPQHPESAIGNLADLQEGQIALSRFIVQRDAGLYVSLSRLESATDFSDFVNRVFASGLYFRGLDYPRFLSLLYDDPIGVGMNAGEEVFLAADITSLRPERQALYQAPLIENGEAAYLFEPRYREEESDQAFVEQGEDLAQPVSDRGHQPAETRVYLDVDEFIANAWTKGVRFGIDVAVVREGLELDKPERRVVARSRPCVPGKDAEIVEQAPGLRRNNAPRRLLGDRVDLRQFETRYPQVAAGIRLVKKTPRTPGLDGWDISGEPLPAPLPKDCDLESLAGPGTRINREADGEYLLASVCGFLNIDRRSNQFSVADKIVSHEGVSVRTTGDLLLTGEVYEQHGEIQEKRVVQCRSITAYADVFGNIVSSGGVVCLKHNLVGGSASNDEGDIVVEGMASGATLTAHHGCITVRQADNCVLLGRQVVVGQATNCAIVADEVTLDVSEACGVAARAITVQTARSRRELDTVLLLLLPDLSTYAAQIAALEKKCAALDKEIAEHRSRIDALRSEKEVASYLLLAGKLRRQEVTLSAEQQVGWRRLSALVAPVLRTMSQLAEVARELDGNLNALRSQHNEVTAAREQACSGIACTVERVEGETRVSTLLLRLADTPLSALPGKDLKARLRRTDPATRLLFSGTAGHFAWSYRPPSA